METQVDVEVAVVVVACENKWRAEGCRGEGVVPSLFGGGLAPSDIVPWGPDRRHKP